jgi:hypothetical protein
LPASSLRAVLSHDYGIPGIKPGAYVPILVLSFVVFIVVVPDWYQLGSDDGLLFFIFAGLMLGLSALSTAITRMARRWRG